MTVEGENNHFMSLCLSVLLVYDTLFIVKYKILFEMKVIRASSLLLIGFLVFFSLAVFVMHNAFSTTKSSSYAEEVREQHESLMKMLVEHNETINALKLRHALNSQSSDEILTFIESKDRELKELHLKLDAKEKEINQLSSDLMSSRSGKVLVSAGPESGEEVSLPLPLTTMEEACDNRYGHGLLRNWKKAEETWCEPRKGSAAKIICYPYTQEHKRADGRGADIFCEAKDLFIDFSKVTSRPGADKHSRYPQFKPGATFSTCKRTKKYGRVRFMNHNQAQVKCFSTFVSELPSYTYASIRWRSSGIIPNHGLILIKLWIQ